MQDRRGPRVEPCIMVTGGAGFIGSNFVLDWIGSGKGRVINLDKLTYAGNLANLAPVHGSEDHLFVQGDVCDRGLVERLLRAHRPRYIVHFAAETHVDRSIIGPETFVKTNIDGIFAMLTAALTYFRELSGEERERFRFLHVSTDEVYGTLRAGQPAFHENTTFAPNSPYAASKAAADHLVRAWVHTYGLPAIITNCSNNYGPRQFPEKLIPLTISNALAGRPLPLYGDGLQVRDWLYVLDHCKAIQLILERGRVGETYNLGGKEQRTNLTVVESICDLLDQSMPHSVVGTHRQLIRFVEDRPGHDRRYAMDTRKIETQLGWKPQLDFQTGLRRTVAWYLEQHSSSL